VVVSLLVLATAVVLLVLLMLLVLPVRQAKHLLETSQLLLRLLKRHIHSLDCVELSVLQWLSAVAAAAATGSAATMRWIWSCSCEKCVEAVLAFSPRHCCCCGLIVVGLYMGARVVEEGGEEEEVQEGEAEVE
jgi:hypothetical protein